MTGIYLLTFANLYTYVGQALDIVERVKQHGLSFVKGKASSKLQNAYNLYGIPTVSILSNCHRDKLDAMEAFYINLYNNEFSLNTKKPESTISLTNIDLVKAYAGESIEDLYTRVKHSSIVTERLKREVDYLTKSRSDEELQADVSSRISSLEEELKESTDYANNLKLRIEVYNKKPWYKRLFTKALL